jgi:hypothetical protein
MVELKPDKQHAGLYERFRKLPKSKKVILVVFLNPGRFLDLACPGHTQMDRCHHRRWRAFGKDHEGVRNTALNCVSTNVPRAITVPVWNRYGFKWKRHRYDFTANHVIDHYAYR